MRLRDLIKALPGCRIQGELPDEEVKGLVYDSRRAGPGLVFAALPGVKTDGHDYVAMARDQGALAALVERPDPGLRHMPARSCPIPGRPAP